MCCRKNGTEATRVDILTRVPQAGALLCSSMEKSRIIYPGQTSGKDYLFCQLAC